MKPRWKTGLALILIVAATIASLWARLPQTHDLNRLAKPIPGTAYHHIMDYKWIDSSSLLTFQDWSGKATADNSTLEAFTINAGTGKSTPLSALNNVVRGDYRHSLCSPDGRWLLLDKAIQWGKLDNEGAPGYNAEVITAVKTDGTCAVTHKFNRDGFMVVRMGWLDDQHYALYHWTESGFVVHIYDVNNAALVQTIQVHDPQAFLRDPIGSMLGEPLWATTQNQHLLLIGYVEAKTIRVSDVYAKAMSISDVDLHFNPAPIQQQTVSLPKGAVIQFCEGNIAPSPDRKRIAWILHFKDRLHRDPNFLEQFWAVHIRHKARLLPVGIPTVEIWMSRIDGREMHQIAYQTEPAEAFGSLDQLKWTPDGKSLSFMHGAAPMNGKDGLYTIPVD